MNKKFIFILLCSFVAIQAGQAPVKDADQKPLVIKIVEGKRIVTETVEGKDIEARLKEIQSSFDKELKGMGLEIEKEAKDLQAKARLIDKETLEKGVQKIERKKKELQLKAEVSQEEFGRIFNNELAKFNEKIRETVVDAAKEKNWDIVKIKETGEIVYNSKRVDATEEIINKHDTRYKAKKAAAKTATPATAPTKK